MGADRQGRAHEALCGIEYGDEPSLLIFADSGNGLDRLSGLAAQAGCRVAAAEALADAAERLDRHAVADAVIAELKKDPGPCFDALLDRLRVDSQAGRHRTIVSVPLEFVDRVFDPALDPDVQLLCEPSRFDWLSAIALAAVRPPTRLNDVGKGQGTARLQQLSEEVGRIANILAALSEDEGSAPAPGAAEAEAEGSPVDAAHIRAIIRARRLRDQFFRSELFADPAWDMLLDLMAARLERQRVAVSSLCIAAAVPPTTALRWIKALCEDGLFVRVADPADGRRVFIELSDRAAAALAAYLRAVHRIQPSLF